MKKIMSAWWYALLFCVIVIIDRITKAYALRHFVIPCAYNEYVTADLVFNRGISWGMCAFEESYCYMIISSLVIAITLLLALYTGRRFYQGYPIIGETFVLAGALSNSADRIWYGGVIDFILLSYGSWAFPVFNCADVCIVIGVAFMCFFTARESS